MRLFVLCLALQISGLAVVAETNAPNLKVLSLEDCVEIALHHNLDVQIKRFNPELSRYTLDAVYGAYDPQLYFSAAHDYNRQPGSVDPQGRIFPGNELETDAFSGGIQGGLPWGTTYNIGISLNDQNTASPGFNNTNGPTIVTNTFFNTGTGGTEVFLSTNFPTSRAASGIETFSGRAGLLELRQPLLRNFWIDTTRLQILIDRRNLAISELDLRSQIMTTITAVEQAYYDLIYDHENVKVQQKAVELASQQLSENQKRVQVGTMAPLDEKQAQSVAAQSRADLLGALGTEETQQRILKGLLSDRYQAWETVIIQPNENLVAVPSRFNLQESWHKGLTSRPDLLQERLSLEKQGYVVKFQRNQLLPQLDLVGTAGYNASAPGFSSYLAQLRDRDNPFWSIGAQVNIPLANTAARNNYRSARATKEQIELQLRQLEQNVQIQIENAIAVANTAFQRVDATREARIYAEAALQAEQRKLENGKSTSFVVLQLTRDLTNARSAEIRALADYNIALAQIALNEGATLERHHITVEVK
jgi:outer membrane protein TolC